MLRGINYMLLSGQGASPIQGTHGCLGINVIQGMRGPGSMSIQLQDLQLISKCIAWNP